MEDSLSSGGSECDEGEVVNEITDEKKYFAEKLTFQRRALMRKNITLQWKQKWTNLWQFFAPVMGLIIVAIIREIGRLGILSVGDKVLFIPFPQIFGLNFRGLGSMLNFLAVRNCHQWYMYDFDKTLS